jgi:soluble lytic murein transglycosylase
MTLILPLRRRFPAFLPPSPTTPPDDPLAPIEEPHEARPAAGRTAQRPARRAEGLARRVRGDPLRPMGSGLGRHRGPPRLALTPLARAQLYTAKGSPPVSAEQVLALLAEAPELPQAEQLQRMAIARGALTPRRFRAARRWSRSEPRPRRGRASPVTGEPEVDRLRKALEPLVKVDDAAGAEALLTARCR